MRRRKGVFTSDGIFLVPKADAHQLGHPVRPMTFRVAVVLLGKLAMLSRLQSQAKGLPYVQRLSHEQLTTSTPGIAYLSWKNEQMVVTMLMRASSGRNLDSAR